MFVYSIIIPHHNIPKLLQRCLDSIPRRPDLEVIIVDDNSDPEIVDFEHFPGLVRSDTTVIFDKSGKGAGRVRNIGLAHAQGKWLLFADADDFFTYCLNDVLDEYVDCDKDIVFFKTSSVDSEYYTNADRDYYNNLIEKYREDEIVGDQLLRYVFICPWGKLIRRKIVVENAISFQETKIHNDVKFSYLTGYFAKTIGVDSRALYCVTYRKDSITNTLTDDKIIDRAKVLAEMKHFCMHHNLPEEFANPQLFTDDLIKLKEQGKEIVYEKCLEAFASFDFSNEMIEDMVSVELSRRKLLQKQAIINKKLYCFKQVGRKVLSSFLHLVIR